MTLHLTAQSVPVDPGTITNSLHLEDEMKLEQEQVEGEGGSLYIMPDGRIVALSESAINMIGEMGDEQQVVSNAEMAGEGKQEVGEDTVLLAGAAVETLDVLSTRTGKVDITFEEEHERGKVNIEDFIEIITTFKCTGCGYMYDEKEELMMHIRDNHLPSSNHHEPVTIEGVGDSAMDEDEVDAAPDQSVTGLSIVVNDDAATSDQVVLPPGTHYKVFMKHENREMLVCGQCSSCFRTEAELMHHLETCVHVQRSQPLKEEVSQVLRFEDKNEEVVSEPEKNTSVPSGETEDGLSEGLKGPVNLALLEADHGLRVLPCPVKQCSFKFKADDQLKYHMGCHVVSPQEGEGEEGGRQERGVGGCSGFRCPECPNQPKFDRWKDLATHLWRQHTIDCDMLLCGHCRNYRTMHPKILEAHNQTHQNLKQFKCDVCMKRFNQISQLKNHAVIHLDKNVAEMPSWAKPKQCDICNKMFSDSKSLKKHVQAIHSKLKPYICQVCGHQSARKAMLQLHVRQHTGEKPFHCDQCDYRTGDHNSLRRHKRRHTGDKPYKCPYCQYAAIQSSSFKSHLKSKHPERPQVDLNGDKCVEETSSSLVSVLPGVVLVGLSQDGDTVTTIRDRHGAELLTGPEPEGGTGGPGFGVGLLRAGLATQQEK